MTGLRIAQVTLDLPIQLSPLASISTPAFRLLCEEQGCGLTWTEMVAVPGLVRGHQKISALLRRSQPGRPFAVQLVGARPDEMEAAAALVASAGAELIDLNMGCPVKKVAKTGGGVALMRDPDLAEALVRAARRGAAKGAAARDADEGDTDERTPTERGAAERDADEGDTDERPPTERGAAARDTTTPIDAAPAATGCHDAVGVTVKMRLGWDQSSLNAPTLAARLVAAGAAAVTVHGRTRAQGFSGHVDLEGIRRVVEAVGHLVPVFGNGDVRDGPSYLRIRAETGCHGVMVGRAALGNPWVFAALAAAARGEPPPTAPRPEDRVAIMRRHLSLALGEGPERAAVREIRKHLIWYSKGLVGSVEFRRRLQTTSTLAEVTAAIDGLAAPPARAGR